MILMNTTEQTALLIAVLLKRAQVKRARISEKTVRVLSRRRHLRTAFLNRLIGALDDLGVHIVELDRGGFGLLPISALEGAESILAKTYLQNELSELRKANG